MTHSSIFNIQHEPPEGVEFGLVWVNDSQCRLGKKLLQQCLPHFTKCWLLR